MLKKLMKGSVVFITFGLLGASAGYVGAHINIVDGRVEFVNTRSSIFIGENAGLNAYSNGEGDKCHNLGIGADNLRDVDCVSALPNTGTRNVCLGDHSCWHTKTGQRNTGTGVATLANNETGNYNVADGYHALTHPKNPMESIAIGLQSQQRAGDNVRNNISIGSYSLEFVQGDGNIGIGNTVGWASTGDDNIFIGNGTGRTNVGGDENVFIGKSINGWSETDGHQLNIANVITSRDARAGHIRLRHGAGIEFRDGVNGKIYRLSSHNGSIDFREINDYY